MLKPKVNYTKTGCEIVYVEIGQKTKKYRVEISKQKNKIITKKIYEGK